MDLFKPPKPKGTRLSDALLKLEISDEFQARKAAMFAHNLNHTAQSLGAKGARVKQLGAYRQAAAFYRLQTGKDFK